MKRQLALFSIYLTLTACTDAGQQVRPVFSLNNEKPRTVSTDSYTQGKYDLAAGQYGHAIEQFRTALRRDPYDVDVLNALGVTYSHLGRRDLARRYLERALALDPSSPVTLNNLGRSWMSDGNWRVAVAYLQRARALDGGDRQIASNLETASARAEAARTPPAEMASRVAPELSIERATPSVQVLHTRPELSLPERGENAGGSRQSAIGASPALASLVPTLDNQPADAAGTPSGRKAGAAPAALAVVNGTGRRGMAARFRSHLAGQGMFASSLANAARYTCRTTVIFYRRGREHEAEKLAATLPVRVAMVRSDVAGSDLRLRLGSDLLDFDARMLAMSDLARGVML
jgi:tetratricopeptide (TPR) repeat protein